MLSLEFLMELTEKIYETLRSLEGTSRFAGEPEGVLDAAGEASASRLLAQSAGGGGGGSFARTLFGLMEEKGLRASEANVLPGWPSEEFERLLADERYRPGRETAAAFCLALRLNGPEAGRLLASADHILSEEEVFDIILLHCLDRGVCDLNDVNEALICFNLKPIVLGSPRGKPVQAPDPA